MNRTWLLWTGVGTALLIGGLLAAASAFQPALEYVPRKESMPATVAELVRRVERQLAESGRMPVVGAQLVHRDGRLEWEPAPAADRPGLVAVSARSVRLASTRSLLGRLLDDDPTYVMQLDLVLSAQDGATGRLGLELWDYGRLTPWGWSRSGTGPSRGGCGGRRRSRPAQPLLDSWDGRYGPAQRSENAPST